LRTHLKPVAGHRIFTVRRLAVPVLAIGLVAAACTSSVTTATTEIPPATSITIAEAPTASPPVSTSTTQPPVTTSDPPPETTPPQLFQYAVIAEETARRLAIIDPVFTCTGCELEPIRRIELPERPHNLVGVGSAVYATHPSAGSVSRVDLATGDILTVAVGTEPHDIDYAAGALYVADEAGRNLLTVDPETLDVIAAVDLPAEAHNLAVAQDAVWVTLNGRRELARISGSELDLFPTEGSPHDLVVDRDGLIWFSNRDSSVLNIFDPAAGTAAVAPAGVTEPHHFAIAPDGAVWVSDNGGAAIVGFATTAVTVEVGSVPHHLEFVGDILAVAVSGSGEAVFLRNAQIVASSQLTTGLHGVAVIEVARPL